MLRSFAVFVGCAIVLTTAHVSIMASGGYGSSTAPLQIAVALGLCVGSVCVGSALGERRWPMAAVFIITLLAGETYTILTTSEVTLSARDAAATQLVEQAAKRAAALEELAAAETASPAPADRSRLQAAEKAQASAEAAVRDKAADKGCRLNCRLLLQSAVDAAQREVAAARTEFNEKTQLESQRLEDRRTAAKAAVAILPQARSATPLADHLRVPEWTLDLLIAALRSVAANGLGAALIAFGAHGKASRVTLGRTASRGSNVAPTSIEENITGAPTPSLTVPPARDHANRFCREMLVPAESNMPLSALHPAYLAWCKSTGLKPFPLRDIGQELAELFKRAGIEVIDEAGAKFLAQAKILSAKNF